MENYPFSAEEAKIATYKSRMRYQKFVNTAIERAVTQGKLSIENIYIDEYAIGGLRGLGYTVEVLSDTPKYMYRREQYLCNISWG